VAAGCGDPPIGRGRPRHPPQQPYPGHLRTNADPRRRDADGRAHHPGARRRRRLVRPPSLAGSAPERRPGAPGHHPVGRPRVRSGWRPRVRSGWRPAGRSRFGRTLRWAHPWAHPSRRRSGRPPDLLHFDRRPIRPDRSRHRRWSPARRAQLLGDPRRPYRETHWAGGRTEDLNGRRGPWRRP